MCASDLSGATPAHRYFHPAPFLIRADALDTTIDEMAADPPDFIVIVDDAIRERFPGYRVVTTIDASDGRVLVLQRD